MVQRNIDRRGANYAAFGPEFCYTSWRCVGARTPVAMRSEPLLDRRMISTDQRKHGLPDARVPGPSSFYFLRIVAFSKDGAEPNSTGDL